MVVVTQTGDDKKSVLDGALAQGDFFSQLEHALAAKPGACVAIKPNIMGASGEATFTDPELVEHLVVRLREHDVREVRVVESRLREGRPVTEVAGELGYTGHGYDLVDLSEDTEPFDYRGVLGVHPAGRAWLEADFRISFAKNKTRSVSFYSGTMANVFGCLPEPDKRRCYSGPAHEPWECVRTALDAMPVHFALLDAWSSRDGSGQRRDRSGDVRETRSVLAGTSVVAVDWVMGERMGVDPALNPMLQEALHRWGRFALVRTGDLMPWDPWRNPSNLTVALAGLTGSRGGERWTIQ
jgi:uncharacterized protein (DUF362 family)